jgi:ADP-ribose pyrophosphatase
VVSIDVAIAALDGGAVFNGLMINALQWLALHRQTLPSYFQKAEASPAA